MKQDCKRENTKRINNDDVDFINDKAYCRNQIEIIEDTAVNKFVLTDNDMSVGSIY